MVVPSCFLMLCPFVHYFNVALDGCFTIKMHHGGQSNSKCYKDYLGGKHSVAYFDYCDIDKLSLLELTAMAQELNLVGALTFYVQGLTHGEPSFVNCIGHDKDIFQMLRFINKEGEVDVYVECSIAVEVVLPEKKVHTVDESNNGDEDDDDCEYNVNSDSSTDLESMSDKEYDEDDADFDANVDRDAEFMGFTPTVNDNEDVPPNLDVDSKNEFETKS